MNQKNKNIFLIIGVIIFLLILGFYLVKENILKSPQIEKKITFENGNSYTQEEIDKFFEMSNEEAYSLLESNSLGEKENSNNDEGSNYNYVVWGCGSEEPQEPKPSPKPDEKFPPKGGVPQPDVCFWFSMFLAKAEKFGDTFTYGDFEKILELAKQMGVYRNPAAGGVGTPGPGPGASKMNVDSFIGAVNFVDATILGTGAGGGNGGDARDNYIIITPGWFNEDNKGMLKKLSDNNDGIMMNFGCHGINGRAPIGHTARVPKGGITPSPDCKSTKIKIKNPDGEISINQNGEVTSSSAQNVPIPGGCPQGASARIESILTITSATPSNPPLSGPPYDPKL